jgi:hypothetical protein
MATMEATGLIKRLGRLFGFAFAALIAIGCSSSGPSSSAIDPSTAKAQLCNRADPTSLDAIASQLEQLRASDTSPISAVMATALANVQSLQGDPAVQTTKNAAATALQDLEKVIRDPSKREDAAKKTATALRTLDSQLCGAAPAST